MDCTEHGAYGTASAQRSGGEERGGTGGGRGEEGGPGWDGLAGTRPLAAKVQEKSVFLRNNDSKMIFDKCH